MTRPFTNRSGVRWTVKQMPVLIGRLIAASSILLVTSCRAERERAGVARSEVERLVRQHATAWETGDTALLSQILHEDALIAYFRRRLDKSAWLEELEAFSRDHTATRVYIHQIVVDGQDFAVEWQFATTDRESGTRTAVSDAIIGRVRDGGIVLWKEYLDGRVAVLQREGQLKLDEGLEPFPWPLAR